MIQIIFQQFTNIPLIIQLTLSLTDLQIQPEAQLRMCVASPVGKKVFRLQSFHRFKCRLLEPNY